MRMSEDRELVEGIKKRNQAAFSLLVDRYGGLIKSIVRHHMAAYPEYQEECVNDILLSIWQRIASYDENKNTLKNWIGAVCKYKAIDYKRKYFKNLMFTSLDENIPDPSHPFDFEMEEEINSLLSCLEKTDRELFYRHYILGEKVSDIAASKGKSAGFFFNRLSRGRKKLKNAVQRSDVT